MFLNKNLPLVAEKVLYGMKLTKAIAVRIIFNMQKDATCTAFDAAFLVAHPTVHAKIMCRMTYTGRKVHPVQSQMRILKPKFIMFPAVVTRHSLVYYSSISDTPIVHTIYMEYVLSTYSIYIVCTIGVSDIEL
jgi:hypothetical protein